MNGNRILQWVKPIMLPGPIVGGSPMPGGMVLSNRGDRIYVTLSRNNTLAMVDLSDNSVTEIPVGVAPYSVVSTQGQKAYVSNWGGRRPVEGETVYYTSGSPVLIDPNTGIANNGSVSVVDLNQMKEV
jgi:YVTN family beta-propeller protein